MIDHVQFDLEIDTQVIVVGGGPGGAAAAYVLGKLDIDTILIDRKKYELIGDKVCGDALAPNQYNLAHELGEIPIPNPTNGELQEICDKSYLIGKTSNAKLKLGHISATVDRLLYGQALIKAVEEFDSVQIMANTRVRDTIIENDTLTGLVCTGLEGTIKIQAKIVVDASGSSGIVRRRLPFSMCTKFPQKIPKDQMIVAYREILKLPEAHNYQKGLYLTYVPEIEDYMPGYYWIFSRGEKEVNVGVGWMLYEKNVGKNIREVNERVRRRLFPDAEVIKSQGDQIPARLPLPSMVHNGFITVGDAAALANPLNGEGHGPALISGIYAANQIKDAIQKQDFSEKSLWEYNRKVWKHYGVEFAMGISVVKFVNKHGFSSFNWLMEKQILQEDDILLLLEGRADEMKLIRRALKGWYKPHILLSLRNLMKLTESIQKQARSYPDYENFEVWSKKLTKLETTKI